MLDGGRGRAGCAGLRQGLLVMQRLVALASGRQWQAGTKVASNTGAESGALSLMLMQKSETLELAKTLHCGPRLSFVHFGERGRGWCPEQFSGPGLGRRISLGQLFLTMWVTCFQPCFGYKGHQLLMVASGSLPTPYPRV